MRVTATDGLRLREGPGTNYDSITVLATGTLLTVTSVASNGWLGVETPADKLDLSAQSMWRSTQGAAAPLRGRR